MRKSVDFDSFDWGQITERDKRLIDKGWRKFWLKRGHFPVQDDRCVKLYSAVVNFHSGSYPYGKRGRERNKVDKAKI